jgi:AbrB family looped-hinge helix DNA binding protein
MPKKTVVRILRNGQITIPKEVRAEMGLEENDLLSVAVVDGVMRLKKAYAIADYDQGPWLRELYEKFAPIREGYAKSGMTEEEINEEIDLAIKEARARHRASQQKAS